MIEQFSKSDFVQLKDLVTTAVINCIDAEEKDLNFIISDVLQSSEKWLEDKQSGVHLVYKVNNSIKGMVLIKDYWNLSSLFVKPSIQRQGIATQLLNHAIKICTTKSSKKVIKLNSSEFASEFYVKYGFKQVGKSRNLPGGCIPYEYNL